MGEDFDLVTAALMRCHTLAAEPPEVVVGNDPGHVLSKAVAHAPTTMGADDEAPASREGAGLTHGSGRTTPAAISIEIEAAAAIRIVSRSDRGAL